VPTENASLNSFDYDATLTACARGDRQALRDLYEQEGPRLLGVAMRIVRQRQQAEDIVHDAFISIWTRAASFNATRGSGRGWIYSVVRNLALNHVRDGVRVVSADEEMIEALDAQSVAAAPPGMTDAFELQASMGKLNECLERLDSAKRNCILYAYVDGCSHSEIAQRLGSPLGSVKAWIKRGLSALQDCMA
jgi:RNA polymerase sigma factor (sigma-70 family)